MRPPRKSAAVKQPIAGIAGTKPRGPKLEGDGHLSRQESRALDREYRLQRNQSLQLKNHREQMLLAKSRGELIEKRLVELQASFLLVSMRRTCQTASTRRSGRSFWPSKRPAASRLPDPASGASRPRRKPKRRPGGAEKGPNHPLQSARCLSLRPLRESPSATTDAGAASFCRRGNCNLKAR